MLVPFILMYRKCLFESTLSTNVKPLIHVIKTLIYGVRSSGNQAESAIRSTGNLNNNIYIQERTK